MKTRFCNGSIRQKEREVKRQNNESLREPLYSTAQFTDLPMEDIQGSIIWPMLVFEDKMNLKQVNKNAHLFFKETIHIDKLLHHVFYGQPKNVKNMIKKNLQLLLQTGSVTCKHTGETLRGTPLRIAWRIKDTEMVALLQKHMDLEDIETQQKAQFPEGYTSYKMAEEEKITEGYKILQKTFDAIYDAEVKVGRQGKLCMDKKTEFAVNRLRDYLKPKGVIDTGLDITDALLIKAFELYDSNYDRFSIPSQNLTLKSPKISYLGESLALFSCM